MKTKHYSPQLDRELVRLRYFQAKALKNPMTKLANELISSALQFRTVPRQRDKSDGANRS